MGRGGRIALAAAAAAIVLFVVAQLVLPGIAADHARARVERYGTVRSVHVSAFPAIELLWSSPDSVRIAADSLSGTAAQFSALLWEARGIGSLVVASARVVLRAPELPGGLAVGNARLVKRGSTLTATATLTQGQLQAALPPGIRIEPIASEGGQVQARASGSLFGVSASLTAVVHAAEGALVVEPQGIPLASLTSLTLFSDPHVKVDSVSLRPLPATPPAYALALSAHLAR